MKPLIHLDSVHKRYNAGGTSVHALRGLSLSIERGEFVAVTGSSGSGKSTLMNILGCLDTPTSGRYVLDGVETSGLSDDALTELRNRKIGFVFQGFNLLARTTALENVELPLICGRRRIAEREARQRARDCLAAVGLESRLAHFPNQLSGGQQQRVAIARALVSEPDIVLADEPTGNLDSSTSADIMQLFVELNRKGITLVLVTHEPDIAAYARRVVHIRDGELVRDESLHRHAPLEDKEPRMAVAGVGRLLRV